MPLDSSRYILPPPLGQSNALYEAYPQKADTVFDTFNNRFPDITTNRITNSSTAASANPFGELPDVSAFDYSYLNLPAGANAANTPQQNWIPDPGNEAKKLQQSGYNNAWNTPANALDSITGNPLGTTQFKWADFPTFIADAQEVLTRSAIVLLGLVFIAAGLFLFAKEQGVIPPMPAVFKK